MHRSLYRAYRPSTFSQVVGQEHITTILKNEVAAGRPSHAFLFTGTRGTGKTSCAKILAKAVNCLQPQEGEPCNECANCIAANDGSLIDIFEIDAASNNSVEDVRSLREEAHFTPAQGRYRVYIIDEVHMLSGSAFNALLKIMEEPPAHVIFILATTEVHKVPATILSRCQRFQFKRNARDLIVACLRDVAQCEGIAIDDEALALLAAVSDGSLRDALSLLDQCASQEDAVTAALVRETVGIADRAYLWALCDAIADFDVPKALATASELYDNCADYALVCTELIETLRGIFIVKSVPGYCSDDPADAGKLAALAQRLPLERCRALITTFTDCLALLSRAPGKRVAFEIALMEACMAPVSVAAAPTRAAETTAPQLPVKPKAKKQTPAPEPDAPLPDEPPPIAEDTAPPIEPPAEATSRSQPEPEFARQPDGPCAQWGDVLARLTQRNPALAAALRQSQGYVSGRFILIDSENDLFFKMMRDNETTKNSLKDAIFDIMGARYSIGPYKRDEAPRTASKMDDVLERARKAGVDVSET